jgi:hypothetical protein
MKQNGYHFFVFSLVFRREREERERERERERKRERERERERERRESVLNLYRFNH